MRFYIPFTFSEVETLKRRSKFFLPRIKHNKKSKLTESLKSCNIDISREEYLSICFRSFTLSFFLLFLISTTTFAFLSIKLFFLFGFGFAFLFSVFIFFSQIEYPHIYVNRKQKNIERNLIPALEDILIQLNSGIPLFSVLTNIAAADYGELSIEFKRAVKRINAAEPEVEVLNDLAQNNPSIFFRRTLWQVSNGITSGSDMSIIVKDSIKSLNEEQLIQIQEYGNKLNPLIMFYMLVAVIIPALSITFLTILSSMLKLDKSMITLVFIGIFVFVFLIQMMFLGLIKSRRPNLI